MPHLRVEVLEEVGQELFRPDYEGLTKLVERFEASLD